MDGWTLCADERERKPRNGVNVTGLCNDDSENWTRVVRDGQVAIISTGPLNADSAESTTARTAPLDSRINDSDVPWRNAFRTAARPTWDDGEYDCSAFIPNFRSAAEKHVHVTRCILNSIYRHLYTWYPSTVSLINDRDLFATKIL